MQDNHIFGKYALHSSKWAQESRLLQWSYQRVGNYPQPFNRGTATTGKKTSSEIFTCQAWLSSS